MFVIDKDGKVAWSRVYDIPTLPAQDDMFRALQKLRVKVWCRRRKV